MYTTAATPTTGRTRAHTAAAVGCASWWAVQAPNAWITDCRRPSRSPDSERVALRFALRVWSAACRSSV
jgi:hypothetical protein